MKNHEPSEIFLYPQTVGVRIKYFLKNQENAAETHVISIIFWAPLRPKVRLATRNQ